MVVIRMAARWKVQVPVSQILKWFLLLWLTFIDVNVLTIKSGVVRRTIRYAVSNHFAILDIQKHEMKFNFILSSILNIMANISKTISGVIHAGQLIKIDKNDCQTYNGYHKYWTYG